MDSLLFLIVVVVMIIFVYKGVTTVNGNYCTAGIKK